MRRLVCGLCAAALALAASASAFAGAAGERATPAGEVVVVLSEQFLNSILEAVAAQPEPPSFPLSKGEGGKCRSAVTLVPEAEGRRTGVRFVEGRITAPVAFRGSYEAPLVGCLNFEGWADAAFNLSFDPAAQALRAHVTVRDVKLRNIPSAMSGGITGLVQDAIDERVNPVEILRAEQLGARVPLARGDGLRLRAREVRHEVVGQELRLRIFYELVRAE